MTLRELKYAFLVETTDIARNGNVFSIAKNCLRPVLIVIDLGAIIIAPANFISTLSNLAGFRPSRESTRLPECYNFQNKLIYAAKIGEEAMKLLSGNIVLTVTALLVTSISAEETYLIAIRTLLHVDEPLPAPKLEAINDAMEKIGTELDIVVEDVVVDVGVPPVRKLRVDDDRKLNCAPCLYYPSYYTGCWVNGIWRDRCRRALTMHEDLTEDAIADLNEDDRRRHLQISTLCQEAKSGVSTTLDEAASNGVVPLPEGGTFVEQCFYEIA